MRSARLAAVAAVLASTSLFAIALQQEERTAATPVARAAIGRTPIVVARDGGDSPAASTAAASGSITTVDAGGAAANVFARKDAVFLAVGSPAEPCRDAAGLPPGDYVVAVTDATGDRLLSGEPASERVVTVGPDGILSAGAAHPLGAPTACGSQTIRLAPFSDAGDEQAGYIVWLTPVALFEGDPGTIDPICGAGCFHGFRPESSRTFAFRVEDKRSCEPTFCVSGVKFEDANANAARDNGEPGLADVEVRVTGENGVVLSGLSGADGAFRVCGLTSNGTYRVTEVVPFGFSQTGPRDHRPSKHLIARDLGWIVEVCDSDLTGLDFANQLLATAIGGVKFEDTNANGTRDPGEPGLAGVTITLTSAITPGPPPRTSVTDASGNFLFSDVEPASYLLAETVPEGFTQTAPPAPGTIAVTLEPGASSLDNAFGNFRGRLSGTISGFKFNDANGNGTRDADEAGLPGVTIDIFPPPDSPVPPGSVRSAVTNADGSFTFTDVPFGKYTVSEVVPAGFAQTAPPPPGTFTVTLSPAARESTNNLFGNRAIGPEGGTGSISGTKIFDLNGNGIIDGVDRPLEGVVFVLTDASGFERRVISGADGTFAFTDLPAGTYVLSEILPPNFFQTFPGSQSAPGTYTITLGSGEARTGILFLNKC